MLLMIGGAMSAKTRQLIQEAVDLSSGSAKKAQIYIKQRLQKEPELLFDLVSPFIDGIIAHAIRRVSKGKTVGKTVKPLKRVNKPGAKPGRVVTQKPLSATSMSRLLGALEQNVSGESDKSKKPSRGKASKRHQDAIHQMVSASLRRQYDGK